MTQTQMHTLGRIVGAHIGTFAILALVWFALRGIAALPVEAIMLPLVILALVGVSAVMTVREELRLVLIGLAIVVALEALGYVILFSEILAPLVTFAILHGVGLGIGSLIRFIRSRRHAH